MNFYIILSINLSFGSILVSKDFFVLKNQILRFEKKEKYKTI